MVDGHRGLRQLPLPPRLKPGQQLDGLTVDALLHESVVTLLYRVHDARGQACVLKTLRPEHDDPQAAAALAHEEWLARRVSDAWFPQVIPHPPRSHLYYLMSWHDGATLKARLDNGHRFGAGEVAELGTRILKGLASLHRLPIVHRDIKPQNIMLLDNGQLRMMDFGIARFSRAQSQTVSDKAIGSVHYISPEQAKGDHTDARTDIYSVGVMMYEMLSGKLPFDGTGAVSIAIMQISEKPKPLAEVAPNIPVGLRQITEKAMEKDPAKRFQSAAEMLDAIETFKKNP